MYAFIIFEWFVCCVFQCFETTWWGLFQVKSFLSNSGLLNKILEKNIWCHRELRKIGYNRNRKKSHSNQRVVKAWSLWQCFCWFSMLKAQFKGCTHNNTFRLINHACQRQRFSCKGSIIKKSVPVESLQYGIVAGMWRFFGRDSRATPVHHCSRTRKLQICVVSLS